MKLAAAAYPLDWFDDIAAWKAKAAAWVADAAGQGADLLVFPEYGAMELASLGGPAVAADNEGSMRETAAHEAAAAATWGQPSVTPAGHSPHRCRVRRSALRS